MRLIVASRSWAFWDQGYDLNKGSSFRLSPNDIIFLVENVKHGSTIYKCITKHGIAWINVRPY